MNSKQVERRAARYLIELDDPSLPEKRRQRIERWLQKEPHHRRVFDALQRVWSECARILRKIH